MRITISSGIAACLLAAAGVVWMTRFDRTASAAEQLQQAVEAGSAYKGWIHMTSDTADLTPRLAHGHFRSVRRTIRTRPMPLMPA